MTQAGISQLQLQNQTQDELIYIVKEDSMNFIGILFEALAVFNYFKDPHHQMCQIFRNRLITQINLSNGIYFEQYQGKVNIDHLKKEALEIILNVLKKTDWEKSENFGDLIKHHLQQNLIKMSGINQIQGDFNQQPLKFSEASLQKVVNSMNHQDQQFSKLKNGQLKCSKLTEKELQSWAKQKFEFAFQQLENNFKLKVQKVEYQQIQTNFKSNNVNVNVNVNANNQQSKEQIENQKEIYRFMQLIVQGWINYSQANKNQLKLIYCDIPINLWQNIIDQFNEDLKQSEKIKFIIQSIQSYLNNQEINIPNKTEEPFYTLNEYNTKLIGLSE